MVMEPLAEAIRQDTRITGIEIAQNQHKLNLFADDIIMTLTNIETSLKHTSLILEKFSEISYYKVNSSKALILGYTVDPLTT